MSEEKIQYEAATPEVTEEETKTPEMVKSFEASDQKGTPKVRVALWDDGHISLCHVDGEDEAKAVCSSSQCLEQPQECYDQAKQFYGKFGLQIKEADLEKQEP